VKRGAGKEKPIELTREQKENAVGGLQRYLLENHEIELSGLQADMLLDYIAENIAPGFYNKAMMDAIAFMTEKADDMYLLMKDEIKVI